MSTINIIIKQFEIIATNHLQINSFGIGDNWEIGANEASLTPQFWVNPTDAYMEKENDNYQSTVYSFNIKCYDLVNKDETNENEVLSDTLQILQDVIAEFNTNPDMMDLDIVIDNSLSFLPFTERFDSEVSGWEVKIDLKQPFNSCYTSKPVNR